MDDATVQAEVARLAARRWPGARLRTLVHLAGDFSTRRYLRASLDGGGAPRSTVVMVLAGSGLSLSSEELGVFPEPPRELPFLDVHRLLAAIGASVPDIYVAAVDVGLLLLEDGGDRLLWHAVMTAPAEAETLYRRALEMLLVLHVRGTASTRRDSIAFAQRFDERLLHWELDHFLEYGVERALGRTLSAATRAGYTTSFAAIARELAAGDLVLSHRDFHSWNILAPDDRLLVIDFQDALLAPPEYDVASLLTDRVTPRIVTPEMEERLLTYYWAGRGVSDVARRRERYVLAALHRALKVIGRIHYVAFEKQKPAPLAFLPDVVATARRLIARLDLPGALPDELAALTWPS